jgi:hypothetical protein
MTKDRFRLVDASISLWYHCMYRCCRKASMLSDENGFQRTDWIDQRLKELNSIFAISVGGFSTMDSHLHLLLRIDCEEAENWGPIKKSLTLVSPLSTSQYVSIDRIRFVLFSVSHRDPFFDAFGVDGATVSPSSAFLEPIAYAFDSEFC